MARLRRWYGAHPLHLLVLLTSFTIAGYAALQLFRFHRLTVLVWFGGAAVGHDLLLLPLYGIADAGLVKIWRRRGVNLPTAPWINYVRMPAMISGILLLIFIPEIAQLNPSFERNSELSTAHFLGDWLLVTGIVFAVSAVLFALRLRALSRRAR